MISNINHLPLRFFNSIEDYYLRFRNPYNLQAKRPLAYTLPQADHQKDGWREVVTPALTADQRRGELYYDEGKDVVTYRVIDISEEEIKARAESEKQSKQAQLIEEKKTEQALASFQTITDEAEALAVKEVYPDWSVKADYLKRLAGYKVTRTLKGAEGYEVRLFSLITPHTPQDSADYYPENAPALWSEIKMQGEAEVWTQPTGGDGKYAVGSKVTHKGQAWENTHPAPALNVWEPGVFGWTKI